MKDKKMTMAIGSALKEMRLAHNKSLQDIADSFAHTRQCVRSWETGRTEISLVDFKAYCDLLNEDWHKIFENAERKYRE